MATSPPKVPKSVRPAVASRRSWRSPPRVAGPYRRWTRRLLATVVGLSLLASLMLLLLEPFQHPSAYFVAVVEPSYSVRSGLPMPMGVQDVSQLPELKTRFALLPWQSDLKARQLDTQESLQKTLRELDDVNFRNSDALVFYLQGRGFLQAPGNLKEPKPVVACKNHTISDSSAGTVSLEDLVRRLGTLTAGTKLLVLDVDSSEYDPRLGQIASSFSDAAGQLIRDSNDPSLWMLTPTDQTQVGQASPALQSTIFHFWFQRGLDGWADSNDSQSVDLGELFHYVSSNVNRSAFIRSGGSSRQTPALVWGGGDFEHKIFPELVSTNGFAPNNSDQLIFPLTLMQSSDSADAEPKPDSPTNAAAAAGTGQNDEENGAEPPELELASQAEPAATAAAGAADAKQGTPDVPAESTLATTEPNGQASDSAKGVEGVAPEAVAGTSPTPGSPKTLATEDATVAIRRGWQAIETLENLPFPRPLDAVPHLWRKLRLNLFWFERYQLDTPPLLQDKLMAQQLRRLVFALEMLASGQPVAESYDPLVARVSSDWQKSMVLSDPSREPDAVSQFLSQTELSLSQWSASRQNLRDASNRRLRFLFQLADLRGLPPSLSRAALELAVLANRTAVSPDCTQPGLRRRLLAADCVRREAERLLFDQTRPDWQEYTETLQVEAKGLYETIVEDIRTFHLARSLQNDVLLRLPHYLQLRYRTAQGPDTRMMGYAELESTIQTLDLTRAALEQQDLPATKRALRRLAPILEQLKHDPIRILQNTLDAETPDLLRLQVLQESMSLDLSDRLRINQLFPELDQQAWKRFDAEPNMEPPAVDPNHRSSNLAAEQIALEASFLQFATRGLQTPASFEALDSCKTLRGQPQHEFALNLARANGILRDCYDALPELIQQNLRTGAMSADSSSVLSAREHIVSCFFAVHNLDARDIEFIEEDAIVGQLDEIIIRDQLLLRLERLRAEQQDVRDADRRYLAKSLDETLYALMLADEVPSSSDDGGPQPIINAPDSLSLESKPEESFRLQFSTTAGETQPVWIVFDYDQELLELEPAASQSGFPPLRRWDLDTKINALYLQRVRESRVLQDSDATQATIQANAKRLTQLKRAAEYPTKPYLADIPPTLQLKPGQPIEMNLRVRRKVRLGPPSKIVVKMISTAYYARHEIDLLLPKAANLELTVLGPIELHTTMNDGVLLHPLPNRSSSFALSLNNFNDTAKLYNLSLLVPTQDLPPILPSGSVSPEQAASLTESLGSTQIAAERNSILIPPGSDIPLLKLFEPELKSEPPPASSEKDEGKPTPFTTQYGMVLRIDDLKTGESLFRRIAISPQRPRRYLQPNISFDATTRRLEIDITAISPGILPDAGINITATLRSNANPKATDLTGLITQAEPSLVLESYLPSSSTWASIQIAVDGYPRAFSYTVPCTQSLDNFATQDNLFGLRIVTPQPDAAFRAPVDRIEVDLEVDAPLGSFAFQSAQNDYLEIGMDLDRDREFRGERPVRLKSDRSVQIRSSLVGDNVDIFASVTDFKLNLPTGRVQDVRANLLAKMVVGQRASWSAPVELILDGSGPTIKSVELDVEGSLRVGDSILVRVVADDAMMSGTAKVQLALDKEFTGQFEGQAPVEAQLDSVRRWSAEVPLSDIPPGTYDLMVQAEDQVGNKSEVRRVPLEILAKSSDPAQDTANTVYGTVWFDNQPLAGSNLSLTPAASDPTQDAPPAKPLYAQTKADGRFRIPEVPAGTYVLRVVGLARNKPRIDEREIEVLPTPQKATRVEFELQ